MELHGTVGPARTTVSAVAELAGVQRATVYRHFPDEEALFAACSAHWYSLHPPPDSFRWADIAEPAERLRAALAAIYGWYGEDEQMFINTSRDADLVPAMRPAMGQMRQWSEQVVDLLAHRRPERGPARRRVRAALAHAISFATWHALTRGGGLSEKEAIAIASGMVEGAGRARA
jgi:AcrR family transcriptional regulator